MATPRAAPDAEFEDLLSEHVNAAMQGGAKAGWILAHGCTVCLIALSVFGHRSSPLFPAAATFIFGVYAMALWYFARRRRLRGAWLYAVLLPFSVLPTVFMITSRWFLPSGAATWIHGPFSTTYFVIIAVSAFAFESRLTKIVGVLSAIGYLVAYAFARDQLLLVTHPDPDLIRNISNPTTFTFKAMIMVFTGQVAGAMSTFMRNFVRRLLDEERQRAMVNRLFGEYVSDEVREKLVQQTGEVKGERRRVAVLFSDIRGFSTFSEQNPPEEILTRLNTYFDGMVDAVARSGGVVDKFIGDAVMATFGGFANVESPCDAAFLAARAMRERLVALNADWARAGKPAFDNGVGIDFGEVVQGPLGSARRKDFTVVGDVVNTASRLEGLTKEHGHPIILTDSVYDALKEEHRRLCVPLGEVKVKGKARAVRIYGVKDAAAVADARTG